VIAWSGGVDAGGGGAGAQAVEVVRVVAGVPVIA
jgi:hypothetical protein